MQENISFINTLFTITIGTLLAGLLGASVRTLRRTEGSLQARIAGYVSAIITVVYLIPFFTWFLLWQFGVVLETPAENLLAFVVGMLSQTITENFIDDPLGSFLKGTAILKKLKRVVLNGENESKPVEPQKILTDEGKTSEEAKQ